MWSQRSEARPVRATFPTPAAAKEALELLCDRGVDASRIRLTDESSRRVRLHGSQRAADRRAAGMAARAVAVGVVAGALIGALLALALWGLLAVPAVAVLMPLPLVGLIVGGLIGGIYRWKENRAWARVLEVPDLDAEIPVTAVVAPASDDQRQRVTALLGEHADEVGT